MARDERARLDDIGQLVRLHPLHLAARRRRREIEKNRRHQAHVRDDGMHGGKRARRADRLSESGGSIGRGSQ